MPVNPEQVELKPCPFCGGEAAGLLKVPGGAVYLYDAKHADGCPMRSGVHWPNKEAAARAWNTRTPTLSGDDVGQVARAIYLAEFDAGDGNLPDWLIPWEEQSEEEYGDYRNRCRRLARAAISALSTTAAPRRDDVETE